MLSNATQVPSFFEGIQYFIAPKYTKDEFLYDCYCCAAKALKFFKDHKVKVLACCLLAPAYNFYLISFIAADAKIFTIFTAIIILPIAHSLDRALHIYIKIDRKPVPSQLAIKVLENKNNQYLEQLNGFSINHDNYLKSKIDEAFEKKDLKILRDAWLLQRRLLLELADKTINDLDKFSQSNGIPLNFLRIEILLNHFEKMEINQQQTLWEYREDVRSIAEPYFDKIINSLVYKLSCK